MCPSRPGLVLLCPAQTPVNIKLSVPALPCLSLSQLASVVKWFRLAHFSRPLTPRDWRARELCNVGFCPGSALYNERGRELLYIHSLDK